MTTPADIIALDPTTITVTRHTKTPLGGGSQFTTANLVPITVRLYHFNTRNQREATLPSGEVKNIDLGLLAEDGTDLVVGHDSYDTFDLGGRTYRIVGVRHYNTPFPCVQADCSAV